MQFIKFIAFMSSLMLGAYLVGAFALYLSSLRDKIVKSPAVQRFEQKWNAANH
jgi:hypothetical protein